MLSREKITAFHKLADFFTTDMSVSLTVRKAQKFKHPYKLLYQNLNLLPDEQVNR